MNDFSASGCLGRPTRLAMLLAATLLGGSAWAAAEVTAAAAAPPPSIVACQACHGRDGISISSDIPNLAGQKQAYLVAQLRAFRAGDRKNELMAAIASQLADAEIEALAAAWSRLPRTGDPAAAPGTLPIVSHMAFPAAFPTGFVEYETIVDAATGRATRRYVDEPGLKALRAGQSLPSGTVIVVVNEGGTPRQPLSYAAMETRAGWGAAIPALLRNGDWEYALFSADRSRRDDVGQAACLACHKPIAADDYVFTMKTLRSFAAKPGAG